nr:uncharacterized protein LOC129385549 [Dermacentor andersoni]
MTEEVSLTGYRTVFGGSKARGTGILLDSKRAHVTHDLKIPLSSLEYVMIEVIPNRVNKKSVFILNVYSAPRDRVQRFKLLLQKASKLAGDHPLIVAGDFNAPYHKVKRFKEKRAYQYFMQMASALAYLHYKDIAHRDLKCENILFTSTNYVKLADFSFARYCSSLEREWPLERERVLRALRPLEDERSVERPLEGARSW